MKKMMISALVASSFAIAGGDIAPVEEVVEAAPVMEESGFQQRILIYGWLPDLSGTLKYPLPPGSGGDVSVNASDLIDALEMVFMGTYEIRKEKWSFTADVIYIDLANSESKAATIPGGPGNSQIEVGADQSMEAWVLGFVGGYNMVQTDKSTFDLIAGARYLSLDVGVDLQIDGPLPPQLPGRSFDKSAELWDAVVGFKGQYRFNENWFMPYYADIGAGDSDLTWQAMAGIGYSYGWGDVLVAYRHLSYDQGDDKLIQDLELSGPAIAVNFRF